MIVGTVGFGRVEFFILIRNVWGVFVGIGEVSKISSLTIVGIDGKMDFGTGSVREIFSGSLERF